MASTRSRARATSLVEVMVATLIVGGAVLVLYQMFGRGAQVSDRTGMAFLAAQLGRESVEELRSLPFADLERVIEAPDLLSPVPGHPLANLQVLGCTRLAAGAPIFTRPDWHYPEIYRRFKIKRTIVRRAPLVPTDAVRHYDVTVQITWTEAGETRSGPADTTFRAVLTAGVQ